MDVAYNEICSRSEIPPKRWGYYVRVLSEDAKIKSWCEDQFGPQTYYSTSPDTGHNWYKAIANTYYFSTKEDAILFLLTWG